MLNILKILLLCNSLLSLQETLNWADLYVLVHCAYEEYYGWDI